MLLAEARRGDRRPAPPRFSRPISTRRAIATARDGLYSEADVADVSPDRLRRFFQRETGGYRVRRDLREMVLFAHHNVIHDPPFSHLDLDLLPQPADLPESAGAGTPDRDVPLRAAAGRVPVARDVRDRRRPGRAVPAVRQGRAHLREPDRDRAAAFPFADAAVPSAARVAPASEPRPPLRAHPAGRTAPSPARAVRAALLRGQRGYTVVHVLGARRRVPAGRGRRAVARPAQLVQPELRADLRTALHRRPRARQPVEVGRRSPSTSTTVRAGSTSSCGRCCATTRRRAASSWCCSRRRAAGAPRGGASTLLQLRARRQPDRSSWRRSWRASKAQLRSTIEQYETQAEEAKAANEELQAMNEELRSAAEELETSKEELQSVNEELTTVNQELKIKIEELALTNNDFQNLINSTDIGDDLPRPLAAGEALDAARAGRLQPAAERHRPAAVRHHQPAALRQPLARRSPQVLDAAADDRAGGADERRALVSDARSFRTARPTTASTAWSLTFHDITARRAARSCGCAASEERLRLLIDSAMDYAIFTMTDDGRVDSWNTGAERMFGYAGRRDRRPAGVGPVHAGGPRGGVPERGAARRAGDGPRPRRALAPAEGRHAVLLQRGHDAASATAQDSASRRSRAT